MNNKLKTQKGFIQIPLLIVIIVSVIAVSIMIASVVSYREEKSVPFVAGVSQVSEEAENTKSDIESEERQSSDTKLEEHQIPDTKFEEPQIEKKQSLPREINQEKNSQIKTEQPDEEELRKRQETALKIEKCKSERKTKKEKLIYEFENVELAKMISLIREMEERSYQKCIQDTINLWKSKIDFSHISGSTYSNLMSSIEELCEKSITETRKKFQPELNKLKAKRYLEIEEQLQLEYQQCLQE